MKVVTLFLDAGGVLVNPNFDRVAAALRGHGVPAEGAALRGAEAHAKKVLDTDSTVNATNDASRGWLYFDLVLKHAGIARDERTAAALRDLAAYHAEHNLWETVPDEVPAALERLRAGGRRLAVLSNANGTVSRLFARLGLLDRFDHVLDSWVEKIEKPDPRFLRAHWSGRGRIPRPPCTSATSTTWTCAARARRGSRDGCSTSPGSTRRRTARGWLR